MKKFKFKRSSSLISQNVTVRKVWSPWSLVSKNIQKFKFKRSSSIISQNVTVIKVLIYPGLRQYVFEELQCFIEIVVSGDEAYIIDQLYWTQLSCTVK